MMLHLGAHNRTDKTKGKHVLRVFPAFQPNASKKTWYEVWHSQKSTNPKSIDSLHEKEKTGYPLESWDLVTGDK